MKAQFLFFMGLASAAMAAPGNYYNYITDDNKQSSPQQQASGTPQSDPYGIHLPMVPQYYHVKPGTPEGSLAEDNYFFGGSIGSGHTFDSSLGVPAIGSPREEQINDQGPFMTVFTDAFRFNDYHDFNAINRFDDFDSDEDDDSHSEEDDDDM